jgi:hypothetical protein
MSFYVLSIRFSNMFERAEPRVAIKSRVTDRFTSLGCFQIDCVWKRLKLDPFVRETVGARECSSIQLAVVFTAFRTPNAERRTPNARCDAGARRFLLWGLTNLPTGRDM